ncbi:unnamed protein product [Spodoptera exigua]|nr:unnamed protein product [Spodoptera exigua]
MIGREEIEISEDKVADVFYAGDAPLNEASLYKLKSGPALAICFRLLNTDVHFVSLVRRILYETIYPPRDEAHDSESPWSPKTAFDRYKSYSPCKEEIWQHRKEEKTFKDDTADEEEEEEEFVIDENEYFPPPGLLIPGFYAPPNDIAKTNGLAVLFPKLVRERVTPNPEFLPPHVLVLLEINKRYKAIETIAPYKHAIINMGIFEALSPYHSVHIAYTVKQFDTLDISSLNLDKLRLAFMMSMEVDVPLLHLMDLNPVFVSRDCATGEEECAAMFPVNYADDYDQFEDFN